MSLLRLRTIAGPTTLLLTALGVIAAILFLTPDEDEVTPFKVAAAALQGIGLALGGAGLARLRDFAATTQGFVVRNTRQIVSGTTNHVRSLLGRRPRPLHLQVRDVGSSHDFASMNVTRRPVDDPELSEEERWRLLQQRLDSIFTVVEHQHQTHEAHLRDVARQLANDREQSEQRLREDLERGSSLVVYGLVMSALGTVLGIWG